MPYVPPWLDIKPSDFTQAAEAGAKIGTQLSNIATDAAVARERIAASAAENASRVAAGVSEAIARLAQQSKENEAERSLREWENQQRIQMQQQTLSSEEDRAKATLGQRTAYEGGMLNLRSAANDIAQQRADITAGKGGPSQDKMTPLDTHLLSDAIVRRRQVEAEINKASGDISTGGAPTRQMLSKLRASQADIDSITKKYSAPPTAGTGTNPTPNEGQRVRSKSTGRTGTIKNGEVVWDDQAQAGPAAAGTVFGGLEGQRPVTSGNMYMGEDLPMLTDRGAQ
jgi:hypothetical protein